MSRFVARYKGSVEALVALVLGLGFSVLALTGTADTDQIAAATLGTLAALSFALLHEHALREETRGNLTSVDTSISNMGTRLDEAGRRLDSVDTAVSRMNKLFNELNDPVPYRVLRYEAEWDISATDGSLAYAWQRKLIQFNQNDVMSLWFWSSPSGSEDQPTLSTGKVVDKVLSLSDSRRRSLISLERSYSRGETLQFDVHHTVHDSFPDTRETVSVEISDSTYFLDMKITFPAGRTPTDIQLSTGADRTTPLSLADPGVNERPILAVPIPDPPRGVTYTISWSW